MPRIEIQATWRDAEGRERFESVGYVQCDLAGFADMCRRGQDPLASLMQRASDLEGQRREQLILQAPVPTTREQAAEFFSRYGGVGEAGALLFIPPTARQLDAACDVAISRGQAAETVAKARQLFEG